MRKLNLNNEFQQEGLSYLNRTMAVARQRRIDMGLTQKELAEMTGVSVSTISKYERGLFPTRVVWLAAIAEATGIQL